ncbi:MAG: restriction endonuclease subunit S [Candidatus Ozemobacteraceae bacterium]
MSRKTTIPKGYKQTEVGVIPEDWDVCRVCDLVKHGPKNGFSGRSGKKCQGTPTLSLAATSSGRLLLNSETVKYLEDQIPTDSPLYLEPGDILVQRSNTVDLVGTTAIFTGPPATFIYPDLMMRLRFKKGATAEWFWRYANSTDGRRFFTSIAAGSTGSMPKISGAKLREMPVSSPPLAEQEAIAGALSDADALIESLEQLIAKKRHLKQGAMQELLTGKKRLPGFNGEWVMKQLGTLCEKITTGKLDANAMKESGDYPFFTCAKEHYWIDEYAFDTEALLVSGNGANVGYVHYYHGKFNAYQRTYVLSGFSSNIQFVKLFMERNLQDRIRVEVNAGNTPYIVMGTLTDMLIALPVSLTEQSAIASVLSDMDAEIAAQEAKLAKARQIKQGMMQELLTGRIRLV